MMLLGVDPGMGGALCFYNTSKNRAVFYKMPVLSSGKVKLVDGRRVGDLIEKHDPEFALIEQLGTFGPSDPMSKAAVGKMCMAYGGVVGAIAAMAVPYDTVTASVWKSAMGLKGKTKEASHALVCKLVPSTTKQLYGPKGGKLIDEAEALAIALYHTKKMDHGTTSSVARGPKS